MTTARVASVWAVAPLVFASGFCALVYQIAWQREFRLVFGASTAASAAVMAVFMGGLGLGGWLLGPRADRHPRPLWLYARLEALVALTAALTPFLLWLVRQAYLAAGGTIVAGEAVGTVLRLLFAALVLLPPTLLAGGTLPAAVRAVQRETDTRRRGLALVYGVNTLGAVAGAFVATFAMLEVLGTRWTLWTACLLNLAVAILARAIATTDAPAPASPAAARAAPTAGPPLPAGFVLFSAAAVGFAFFLMELVWYRMLGPILGGTVYTFGLILAVALLGIGLGGLLYAVAGGRRPVTVTAFAATCILEAAAVAGPLVAGDRIAVWALRLRPADPTGLADLAVGWALVTAVVIGPAAVIAGVQFPLLVALLGRGRASVGRHVGLAYASNTAGAIVGSLAGGFGLLPLLTAPGCWRAAAVLLALLGLAAAAMGGRRWSALAACVATGAVAAVVLAVPGPTAVWRHSGIGAGRARSGAFQDANEEHAWMNHQRRIVFWEAEGVESSVAMLRDSGVAFVVNGKADGNSRSDAPTQVMGGLLGALVHHGVRSALVVGLGTGSTAGWLGAVPAIERTDVVELEPAVVEVARACRAVNRDVLSNPRVHLRIADAREVLMTNRERYDLVFSEPSNPYRAGLASLFTREFYRAVAERLQPGGLFLQWLQGYEVDDATIAAVLATLSAEFGAVEIWQTYDSDLLLVASELRRTLDLGTLARRVGEEPYRAALRDAWRTDTLEGVLARFVAGPQTVAALAKSGPGLNTDDRNRVEFGFARTVGGQGGFRLERVRRLAARLDDDRPEAVNGSVDWARVAEERVSMHTSQRATAPSDDATAPDVRTRILAHGHYLAGKLAEAADTFRRQPRPAEGIVETALLAEALAAAGEAAAEPYVAALARTHPIEAQMARAQLYARTNRDALAVRELTGAFAACRTDPWPWPPALSRALALAEEVAQRTPALAATLHASLAAPFAARVAEEDRLATRVRLAHLLDARAHCQAAIGPLEPHVPWSLELLLFRRNCYEATRDPRRVQAMRDLDVFLKVRPAGVGPS